MTDNGATSTWSGYNHQGKVGLFVALREMALLTTYNDTDDTAFGERYVEFEGAEDFDICIKPPCHDSSYLHSRHQVKAYAGAGGRYFSDYNEVTEPYTNRSGTSMPGFDTAIKDDEEVAIIGVEVPVDKRFIHLVQPVPSWKDEVENNPNQVSPYEYPSYANNPAQKYCGLSNSSNNISTENEVDFPLDEAAYDQIGKIVPKNRSEIKLIWLALQVELQKRIASCHDDSAKMRPKFTFQEIFDDFLVSNVSLSAYINDYEADVFRRSLINAWHDIQTRYEEGNGIEKESQARIEAWLRDIQEKSNVDLKVYVDSFSPDIYPPPKDIQRDGFQEVVCEVIRQVKAVPSVNTYHYKKDNIPYFLTTINLGVKSYPVPALAKSILRGIDNSSDNRYKQSCLIVTREHDFDLDDPAFAEKLEYNENSEKIISATVGGINVPNIEAYQPRRVIPVSTAVQDLSKGCEL